MKAEPPWLALLAVSWLGALTLSCASSDGGPASGGSSNGGSASASGGMDSGGTSSGGNVGIGGTSGQSVDCTAVCARVKTVCSDNAAIDDTWLSVCKSACDARVQVAPETAVLERACVMAATDCTTAVTCVASPH